MNAVEIEQAISELAEKAFDRQEFPFQFLVAFGDKETTLKRLRIGVSNKSDLGGVLQTNNIRIATCALGHPRRPTRQPRHHTWQSLLHQGDRPPEPTLCRTAEGQPPMGHRGTPSRREALHGAADRLLLCRRHRYLQQRCPVHHDRRPVQRPEQQQHELGHQRNLPRDEYRPPRGRLAQLGLVRHADLIHALCRRRQLGTRRNQLNLPRRTRSDTLADHC